MLVRLSRLAACCLLLNLGIPSSAFAQAPAPPSYVPPPGESTQTAGFSVEQIDALVAPVALYPDPLLTQLLMATTFPLQVVDAARWVAEPEHRGLSGDALVRALEPMNWDPSVKSLVPFPQVLAMMDANHEWLQQIGYAFAGQPDEVMDSVQRLRAQAQAAGNLASTPQQAVSTQTVASAYVDEPPQQIIVIQPVVPTMIYVPYYNPLLVFGVWPYLAYPPVYLPLPPYYVTGTVVGLLTFSVAVVATSVLWGWATPRWGYRGPGPVFVNVNRYNMINVGRPPIRANVWQPSRPGLGRPDFAAPPGGPVGPPRGPGGGGLPANAVGRPAVQVPGNVVNRPAIGGGPRPTLPNAGPNRPGGGVPAVRPGAPAPGVNRSGGGATQRQVAPPQAAPRLAVPRPAAQRPGPGAISGMDYGRQAPAVAARGAQSRSSAGAPRGGGGGDTNRRPGR